MVFSNLDAGNVLSSQGATHVNIFLFGKSTFQPILLPPGPPSIFTSTGLYDRVRDDPAEAKVTKCHVCWEAGGLQSENPFKLKSENQSLTDSRFYLI